MRSTNDPYDSACSLPESSMPSPSQSTGVGNRRLERERAGDADDLVVDLRPIDEHFLVRRLVVGDALERDVRDDAADFLALLVLLARRRTRRRAALAFFQLVVVVGGRQQALPCKRERHAARVDRDPPPAPLLGDVRRRPAAARRVEHEIAGVGGHQNAALEDLRAV